MTVLQREGYEKLCLWFGLSNEETTCEQIRTGASVMTNDKRTAKPQSDANQKLLDALKRLSSLVTMTEYAFSPENVLARSVIEEAESP